MKTSDDLAEFLDKRTREEWNSTHSPYLLSRVAPELKAQEVDYRELIAPISSLKQFAGTLKGRVKVVQHPVQNAKVGLIPSSEEYSFEEKILSPSRLEESRSRLRILNPRTSVINFLEALSKLEDSEIEKVNIPVGVLVRMMYPR